MAMLRIRNVATCTDLDNSQVAELAKKSIRITKENREMEELLNDIYSKLAKFVKEHKIEEL